MPNRRDFLRTTLSATAAASATLALPPVIRKALAIPANRRTGTIADVEHVVILMQENRSFDHYFGTLNGVRGFGDRFPIPVADAPGIARKTVWFQSGLAPNPTVQTPFRLNTEQSFELMKIDDTPHRWPDSQLAWDDGRMSKWPRSKNPHSMGYYALGDAPFQFALAEAFTLCDAYHCSIHGSTNPNRLFHWTGTNDPTGAGRGPALSNHYDSTGFDPDGGYTWKTYAERLQAAGVSWQTYQNMADNFTDNPVAGFRTFRDAFHQLPGANPALLQRGLSTRDLDLLLDDVVHDRLPAVSWIVATAEGSEHPDTSSPAQGADYTARVIEALTANPKVWAKTVLFVNYDENDGFFDHVPPPAPPSFVTVTPPTFAGASTVDTAGEYHAVLPPNIPDPPAFTLPLHKPYGLGMRVPMFVISPWSKGGFVNSEVFDHTSVLRFLEQRFGIAEPNISPWRRAVCGDLTSCFDFADPDNSRFDDDLPDTQELAELARALPSHVIPQPPAVQTLPVQDTCARPARALPYELNVTARVEQTPARIALRFDNTGHAGAVFHVYDRLHLDRTPRRYTVERGRHLIGTYDLGADAGRYDLWVLGPAGFHRHVTGRAGEHPADPEVAVKYHHGNLVIELRNQGAAPCSFVIIANAYFHGDRDTVLVRPGRERQIHRPLRRSARWYDFTVEVVGLPGYRRRFAGHIETGRDSLSDPAIGGIARGDQTP